MLKLFVSLVVVAVVSANLVEEWEAFKAQYEKNYGVDEEHFRFTIFATNLDTIERHNKKYDAGQSTYKLGVNQFADMTVDEFSQMMNGFGGASKVRTGRPFVEPRGEPADTMDWRDKGAVTDIKDQAQCGSCWAFSTTGSLEGQHFLKTGKLVSLSEQNLVDCSGHFGNMGCFGGLMDNAFRYIKFNHGIDTEISYPYEAMDGECRFDNTTVGATCTGYVDLPSEDEDALKKAVSAIGPISVAIDAGHESFQFYQKGVYYEEECSSSLLDHGVLAIGYGTDNGNDYWLVKNSWGTSWGMDGFIHMSRNKDNNCGIATQASYPTV
ncbi:procathepsin L-like [Oratosquilla oratoria]|uniref:procathepsin L-like n=1 Tax=Oratosquilla oratoria TaxID=337810 RepID=UPI003F777F3E